MIFYIYEKGLRVCLNLNEYLNLLMIVKSVTDWERFVIWGKRRKNIKKGAKQTKQRTNKQSKTIYLLATVVWRIIYENVPAAGWPIVKISKFIHQFKNK